MLDGKGQSLQIQQVTVVKLEEAIVRVITKFPQAENTIIFNNIGGCVYFNSTLRNNQGMLILIRKGGPILCDGVTFSRATSPLEFVDCDLHENKSPYNEERAERNKDVGFLPRHEEMFLHYYSFDHGKPLIGSLRVQMDSSVPTCLQ